MSADDAELFCERFKGHYTESTHKILGGEPTATPPDIFYEVVDVFYNDNRKLKMLTNGFNILGLDPAYLNKFECIEFDDHGINHRHVLDCIRHLKTFYTGKIEKRSVPAHYNLEATRKTCIPGDWCWSIMAPPILFQNVIYPCCIHPGMELLNNNQEMKTSLIDAGWSLDNPDVCTVMENWEQTIPDYVKDQCSHHCWIPRRCSKTGESKIITLKPNDVIKRV
jgi:hypothetical protein